MRRRADAVVGPRVVVAGVVVVAVVHAAPPVGWPLAAEQRGHAPSLHRLGHRESCEVENRRGEVDVGHELLRRGTSRDPRPPGKERHAEPRFVHEPLVVETEVAEVPAVVAGVDHDRVVGEPLAVEPVEHPADPIVHALHAGEVILHEPLVLPADQVSACQQRALHLDLHRLPAQPPLPLLRDEIGRRFELEIAAGEIAGNGLLVLGERCWPRGIVVEERGGLRDHRRGEPLAITLVGRPLAVGRLLVEHQEKWPVLRPRREELEPQVGRDLRAVPIDRERAARHEERRVAVGTLTGQHGPAVKAGGVTAEVPLADHAGVVTPRLHPLGEVVSAAVEPVEHRHTVFVGILAGEQRGPAGRADRVGDERVEKACPARCQPIEVGRLVDLRAVTGEGVLGMVVGEDEQHVGPHRGGNRGRRKKAQHDRDDACHRELQFRVTQPACSLHWPHQASGRGEWDRRGRIAEARHPRPDPCGSLVEPPSGLGTNVMRLSLSISAGAAPRGASG